MMLTKALPDFLLGVQAYVHGLSWLFRHKRYFFLLLIPMFSGITTFFGVWIGGFYAARTYLLKMLLLYISPTAEPSTWISLVFSVMVFFGLFFAAFLLSQLVVCIIAAPIYDIVSSAVERSVTGKKSPQISFSRSLLLIKEELKKSGVVFLLPFIFSFIPFVNILTPVVAAFCLGWDFYDYPMARRGWKFSKRWSFVKGEFFAVMGFGLWLMVPFLSIILMSLAVVGGTLLNIQALKKRGTLSGESSV